MGLCGFLEVMEGWDQIAPRIQAEEGWTSELEVGMCSLDVPKGWDRRGECDFNCCCWVNWHWAQPSRYLGSSPGWPAEGKGGHMLLGGLWAPLQKPLRWWWCQPVGLASRWAAVRHRLCSRCSPQQWWRTEFGLWRVTYPTASNASPWDAS